MRSSWHRQQATAQARGYDGRAAGPCWMELALQTPLPTRSARQGASTKLFEDVLPAAAAPARAARLAAPPAARASSGLPEAAWSADAVQGAVDAALREVLGTSLAPDTPLMAGEAGRACPGPHRPKGPQVGVLGFGRFCPPQPGADACFWAKLRWS